MIPAARGEVFSGQKATKSIFTLLGLVLAAAACGDSSSTFHSNPPGSTGGAATIPLGTGGAIGSGGKTGAGGGAGTGGVIATGGTGAYDGGTGAYDGGTGAYDGGTGAYDGGTGDVPLSTSGCSCAGQTTTWECFCQAFDCGKTLTSYNTDGGLGVGYSALKEYADCNLVVVEKISSVEQIREVFDKTSGKLVGKELGLSAGVTCPFGAIDGSLRMLTAGTFPDATCVRSRCVEGDAKDPCMPGIDGGARPRG